jgi:hypothetical protein
MGFVRAGMFIVNHEQCERWIEKKAGWYEDT